MKKLIIPLALLLCACDQEEALEAWAPEGPFVVQLLNCESEITHFWTSEEPPTETANGIQFTDKHTGLYVHLVGRVVVTETP